MEQNNNHAYSTVEEKIRAIVSSLGECISYQFCNWAQANVTLDKIDKPTVVYVLPPSGSFDFSWNMVRDSPNSQIAFLCNTCFDFNGSQNDCLIEQMKTLCIKFVRALNESGLFEQIDGNLNYRVLYDYLDQNVTGIVIEPTLKETEGVSLCNEPKRI